MLTFLAWLVPVLIAAQLGFVAYKRRDRYPRFLFNYWAPTIYAALVCGDLLLAAGLTALLGGSEPAAVAQRTTMLALAGLAAAVSVVIGLLSLFFRWVVSTNIKDV